MHIPKNVLVNADDLGLNDSINKAVLHCYNKGIINSASLITNMPAFDGAIQLIGNNRAMRNIGVHVNLAEGKPIVFKNINYLDNEGNWDISKTSKKTRLISREDRRDFLAEIYAQIDKALAADVRLTHIDSHYHLHTLPCFYKLFLQGASHYNLKIRLAQTYRESNHLKYWFRRFINAAFIKNNLNYTLHFETVEEFLKREPDQINQRIEVMLHPDFDDKGNLTDHVDAQTMLKWLAFLKLL